MDEPIPLLEPAEPNLDQLTYIQKHTIVVLKKLMMEFDIKMILHDPKRLCKI